MTAIEANPWRRTVRPLVGAHRGQSSAMPENTLDAFRRAIELGAEMIEGDVQATRDGRLVMMHDETITRTTGGEGRVADLRWGELQRLDAGHEFGDRFKGVRIPSLEAVLNLAQSGGVAVCVDVKAAQTIDATATATAVAGLIRQRDAMDWVVLNSFFHEALVEAKRVLPELQIVPDVPLEVAIDASATVRLARSLGAKITMNHADLPAETVALLHEDGVAVWVWGAQDEAAVARSVAQGVDGILGADVVIVRRVVDDLRGR